MSDFDSRYPGMEGYSGDKKAPYRRIHAANGSVIATEQEYDFGYTLFAAYWDADLQRELIHDKTIFDFGSENSILTK